MCSKSHLEYYKRHRIILDSLKTILSILKETIFFLQILVDTFYDNHKTCKEIKGLFALAEVDEPPQENPLKELPLTDLEHKEFLTSIVSPGNIFSIYSL